MKTIFKLLLLALVFTSCDDVEPTVFNGNNESNDSFLSFSQSVYNLTIERDGVGELEVVLNASTVSSSDRVYNIEVDPGDTDSAANPATYTVPTTITIPAGEFQGMMTISGVDGGLVDAAIKNFTINITNLDAETEYMDSESATINVYEVCTVFADFSGNYEISMPNLGLTDTPYITAGVYNLATTTSPFERTFTVASPYADFGVPSTTFTVSLACGASNFTEAVDTGLACATGNNLINEPAPLGSTGSYDPSDDSSFTVRITENAASACGGSPVLTTIQFTKVE
ncbi:MAG: hypothetical protein BM557_04700 [Flavobacterium sp. MedPE-SWcel]|uniref:hypothetical protein n=1 Tax=uncultured Flavobacterium sp. TaxID=165435 RepID=UPI00091FAE4F|nr:hypothetical protein [uncultured Flavobacterium sp.]OIQ21059.1 MAG: hypothetical protein BM557_04700 [Flavobacterium sp. MedPE-SWcel]